MTRLAVVLIMAGLAFALAGTTLALAHRHDFDQGGCSWGASSIAFENGHVVSGPSTTGCLP